MAEKRITYKIQDLGGIGEVHPEVLRLLYSKEL